MNVSKKYEDIINLVKNGDFIKLQVLIDDLYVSDLVSLLEQCNDDIRYSLFSNCKIKPEALLGISEETFVQCIKCLGANAIALLMDRLESHEIVMIIQYINDDIKESLIYSLEKEKSNLVLSLLAYTEETAGRIMQPYFVIVQQDWDMQKVNNYLLTKQSYKGNNIQNIIVVDDNDRPVGILHTRKLIVCDNKEKTVKDLMDNDIICINDNETYDHIIKVFNDHRMQTAPVVDNFGKIIGIILVTDVMRLLKQEVEEEILNITGVVDSDVNESAAQAIIRRIPWLLVILLGALLNSFFIGTFEDTLVSKIQLAVLMPITAALTGNSGIQTSTITIRLLATERLSSLNIWRFVLKEAIIGLILGIKFAVLAFIAILWRYNDLDLACVFSYSLVMVCTVSGIIGTLVPITLNKIGSDPAISSNTIIASITDILSFSVFLALATYLLI